MSNQRFDRVWGTLEPPREAAGRPGITQPRVSELMRGWNERFSVETLVASLSTAIGVTAEVALKRAA